MVLPRFFSNSTVAAFLMSALFYGPVHAQTAPEGESSEPPPLITAPQEQLARPAAPGVECVQQQRGRPMNSP